MPCKEEFLAQVLLLEGKIIIEVDNSAAKWSASWKERRKEGREGGNPHLVLNVIKSNTVLNVIMNNTDERDSSPKGRS